MLTKVLRFVFASALALACVHAAAGGWTSVNPLVTPRSGQTATLLPNVKILVAGGATGFVTNAAELFDPATGQWQATGNMHTGRLFHTATLLHTGKVLVAGGLSAGTSRADAELYDPSTGHWVATESLPYACDGHAATLMRTGQVLITGGFARTSGGGVSPPILANSALYDPPSGHWTSVGAMPAERVGHNTVMLMDMGQVLVVGGG
jgi:N-acetylneuraminic acid mutarotase